MEIYLPANPPFALLEKAVLELKGAMGTNKEYPQQKIKVQFSEEVNVVINRRTRKKVREMRVKFFKSTDGDLCYTFNKRHGWSIDSLLQKIASLSICKGESAGLMNVKRLIRLIHPNAWSDLRARMIADPQHYADNYGLSRLSIVRRFPTHVVDSIKEAFENQLAYSYRRQGRRRDIRVEMRLCDDGIFRAWYSSEYPGCANGQYFLLLNPTTAALSEYD